MRLFTGCGVVVLGVFASLVGGCGAAGPVGGGQRVVRDLREARLDRVSERLACDLRGRLVFDVIDSDRVSAFAWPDGRVCVTRGLVDCLDDAELTAAVAHELGHLLGDGHVRGVVSLHGDADGTDVEARADALGVQLLDAKGLQVGAMGSMLRKVRAAGNLTPECAAAIDYRVSLLAARGGAKRP